MPDPAVTASLAQPLTEGSFLAFNRLLRAAIGALVAGRGWPEMGAAFAGMSDQDSHPTARVFGGDLAAECRYRPMDDGTKAHHTVGLALLAAHPDVGRDPACRRAFSLYALISWTGGSGVEPEDLAGELDYVAGRWPDMVDALKGVCASALLQDGVLAGAWDVVTGVSVLSEAMLPSCGRCPGCGA